MTATIQTDNDQTQEFDARLLTMTGNDDDKTDLTDEDVEGDLDDEDLDDADEDEDADEDHA